MSRIIRPGPELVGRAETAPELVLYLPRMRHFVDSLLLHARGLGEPDATLWYQFAVTKDTPSNDRRILALTDAAEYLIEGWPALAASDDLRAYQIVSIERRAWARTNANIRGTLTTRLVADPNEPRRLQAQLEFQPSPNEPPSAAHFNVLRWNDNGRTSAIVLWDAVPLIARGATDASLLAMIRAGLRHKAAQGRWDRLMRYVSPDDVRTLYFEVTRERPSARGSSARILERLERSVRAGMPSRTSRKRWVPSEAASSHGTTQRPPGIGTAPSAMGDDDRIDLRRAMSRLDSLDQEVLSLHSRGHTDAEIAQELGVTHQAVNKRRRKAQGRLREMLGG